MAHRGKQIKKLVARVLEEDLGLEIVEFGHTKSSHQYARVKIEGDERDMVFSLSPSSMPGRGGLRADFRKRLSMWGYDVSKLG